MFEKEPSIKEPSIIEELEEIVFTSSPEQGIKPSLGANKLFARALESLTKEQKKQHQQIKKLKEEDINQYDYFVYLFFLTYLQLRLSLRDARKELKKVNLLNNIISIAFGITRIEFDSKIKAAIDELTKIPNRRSFDNEIDRLKALLERDKKEPEEHLTAFICFIDVDRFKNINDTYGHSVGDKMLQKLASLLQKNFRKSQDFIARYGGDEFVVILSFTQENIQAVKKRIEEIFQKINQDLSITIDNEEIKMTISMGVATINPDTNIEIAKKESDNRLFKAKKTGRSKIVFEDDPIPTQKTSILKEALDKIKKYFSNFV